MTSRHPGLTCDRQALGVTALGAKAIVRRAEVGPGVLCSQSNTEGVPSCRGGRAAPQGHVSAIKLVQDAGRTSLGLTGKHQPVSLHSSGSGRAEGEDRTRHGDGDREGHRLAAPDTQAVVCGAEVGPGVLCLQIELEGRRFPKSDLRLPENHFFMKKLVLDRVRACLGFTGKCQPVSFDSLGAGRVRTGSWSFWLLLRTLEDTVFASHQ